MKMSSSLLIGVMLCCAVVMNGQTPEPKQHRNEIGIDATYLLARLIPTSNVFPESTINFTYRRYFNGWNLRSGIGLVNAKQDYRIQGVEETFLAERSSYQGFLGIERTSELHERWQVFYGLDFLTGREVNIELTIYNFDQGIRETTVTTTMFGVSPLLGVRFRINDRLSLFSEASYMIISEKSSYAYAKLYEEEGFTNPSLPDNFDLNQQVLDFVTPYTIRIAFAL